MVVDLVLECCRSDKLETHEKSTKTQTNGWLVVRAWREARVACRDDTAHRADLKAHARAQASRLGAYPGVGSDVLQNGSLDASWPSTGEILEQTRPGTRPTHHVDFIGLG